MRKNIDPACGSGSLILKAVKILGKDKVRLGFFGQEINITTYNLCRINMFLHDIDYDKFDIALGDTLTDPLHWDDEPFEAIVSNPPYSLKWKGDSDPILINDPRFSPAGVLAPKSKADLAFIMHSLSWLATNGTAAIVCFPGVMYRGRAEKKIRQYLIGRFIITDLTFNNNGAYYEAGYAKGQGKKVIHTCSKDWFEKNGVHFDVTGLNLILYDSDKDFAEKLKKRIRETIY